MNHHFRAALMGFAFLALSSQAAVTQRGRVDFPSPTCASPTRLKASDCNWLYTQALTECRTAPDLNEISMATERGLTSLEALPCFSRPAFRHLCRFVNTTKKLPSRAEFERQVCRK